MVAHVVLFSPKPALAPEARQRLVDALARALREIPSIRRAHVGRRIATGRPYEQLMTVDYQYAAVIEFDDAAGLAGYLTHEAHTVLGASFFEAFDVALMYDYEMHEGQDALALLA